MIKSITGLISWRHIVCLTGLLLLSSTSIAHEAPANPRGSEEEPKTVRWQWDAVPETRHYEVTVDGQYAGMTTDLYFISRNLWVGEHSMTVISVHNDGHLSDRTDTIKVIVTGDGGGRIEGNNQASSSSGPLSQPQNARGSEIAPRSVKWEWDAVSGAAIYEVRVDGAVIGTTVSTSATSNDLWIGEHSMEVTALTADRQRSPLSKTIKVNVTGNAGSGNQIILNDAGSGSTSNSGSNSGAAGIPQNPRGQQIGQGTVKWEWDWVPGASQYEIRVDGVTVGTTGETSHVSNNLWVGEHSLSVKSISSSGQYSEASNTIKVIVGDNASTTTAAIAPPPPSEDTGRVDAQSWYIPEAYEKPGYELVFSDEFNGGSLNPNRWNSQLRWDGEWNGERYEYRVVNQEDQFYVNVLSGDPGHKDTVIPQYNPFEFNGSRLGIRAIRNPLKLWNARKSHGSLYEMVSQQHFLSGAISTYDKFTQKFGYFEARMKIPSHVGTFPAFWLHHQKRKYEGTRRTEIDIMENLGHAPWYVYNTFHYFTNVSDTYGGEGHQIRPYPDGQIYNGTDFSQDFHTYAVEWEPGHIAWFIDGQKVSEVWNNNADHEELYIIINLALGGNWTNYPASSGGLGRPADARFPNASDLSNFNDPILEIDYVRAYRKK